MLRANIGRCHPFSSSSGDPVQHDAMDRSAVGSVFRRMGVDAGPSDGPFRYEPLIWFTVILGCITIGQRFAIPFDESQFGFGFLFCLLITVMLAVSSRLTIDPTRMLLYFVAISGCLITLFFKRNEFSTISLLMLFVVYFSYIFSLKLYRDQYISILGSFQDIMLFCAWCGLIQFLIQFVLSPDYMFPFDLFVPEQLFIPEFNLRIPITDEFIYEKSTGLWFLEPSIWSQFLAFAVIIELRYFNRTKRLMIYLGSIGLCFSGTGPILLISVGAVLVFSQGRFSIVLLAIIGFACIFIFKDVFPFSVFYERLSDFSNPLASGSGRFFATYWAIADLIQQGRFQDLIWGLGPGQLSLIVTNTDYYVQDSSWFKMIVEYGFFGLFFFSLFFLTALFRKSPDKILSLACLVQYLFLGGYLLSFYVHFLYLVLVVWPEILPDEDEVWDESETMPTAHDDASVTADGPLEEPLAPLPQR